MRIRTIPRIAVRREFQIAIVNDEFVSTAGTCRLGTFPIGIDVDEFARRRYKSLGQPGGSAAAIQPGRARNRRLEPTALTIQRVWPIAFALSTGC